MEIDRDRLSNLPDHLLHHILSSHDIKDVIQLCILSKRWRTLWMSHQFIHFNARNSTDFITKVLLFRESHSIRIFTLTCEYVDFSSSIYTWIHTAIRRNVKELYLRIVFEPEKHILIKLPNNIFHSKSLTVLKLTAVENPSSYGDVGDEDEILLPKCSLPQRFSLPSLKVLHLQSLALVGASFMQKIFAGCPILQTLVLNNCRINGNTSMSGTSLQHLKIDTTFMVSNDYGHHYKITVSAPNLKTFICRDLVSNEYQIEGLSSIAKADIDMTEPYDVDSDDGPDWLVLLKEDYGWKMTEFLKGLCNVSVLTLSTLLLEVLPEATVAQPAPFSALRHLKLLICLSSDCIQGIKYILNNSCNLERLYLEITREDRYAHFTSPCWDKMKGNTRQRYEPPWGRNDELFDHKFYYLKYIRVEKLLGYVDEVEFLKSLLKNAVCLEQMKISFSGRQSDDRNGWRNKICEALKTFPKAPSSRIRVV